MGKDRAMRIRTIVAIVEKCGMDGAMKEKLIAQCQLTWSCSRRTLLEYIKVLVNTDQIKQVEDMLYANTKITDQGNAETDIPAE